jgi:hypothetical protein
MRENIVFSYQTLTLTRTTSPNSQSQEPWATTGKTILVKFKDDTKQAMQKKIPFSFISNISQSRRHVLFS